MLLTTALLIFTTNPILIQGDFTADFSDSSLSNWTLYADDANLGTRIIPHTWEVQSGSLVSAGTYSSNVAMNYACQETGFDEGVWSYDLYGPEDDSLWRFSFRISQFPGSRAAFPDTPVLHPSHLQVVSVMGINEFSSPSSLTEIVADQFELGNSRNWVHLKSPDVLEDQLRGWHSYKIEKNSTHVVVYLDEVLLLSSALVQDMLQTYDSVCMWTEVGNGVKIDNISVNPFVGGISSNSGNPNSQLTSTPAQTEISTSVNVSTNGDTYFQYAAIGAGLITISTIGYFSTITIKKKD